MADRIAIQRTGNRRKRNFKTLQANLSHSATTAIQRSHEPHVDRGKTRDALVHHVGEEARSGKQGPAEIGDRFLEPVFQGHLRLPTQFRSGQVDVGLALSWIIGRQRME